VVNGERDPQRLTATIRETVATEPTVELEYVEVRDAASIAPIARVDGGVLLALAAHVGGTRLIDNVGISVAGASATVDLGTISADPIPVAP
jgi:pantothenate synthetase